MPLVFEQTYDQQSSSRKYPFVLSVQRSQCCFQLGGVQASPGDRIGSGFKTCGLHDVLSVRLDLLNVAHVIV